MSTNPGPSIETSESKAISPLGPLAVKITAVSIATISASAIATSLIIAGSPSDTPQQESVKSEAVNEKPSLPSDTTAAPTTDATAGEDKADKDVTDVVIVSDVALILQTPTGNTADSSAIATAPGNGSEPIENTNEEPSATYLPSTLVATPADGVEVGIYPRLMGSGISDATVHLTITNELGEQHTAAATVDSAGNWHYTPSGIHGTLTVSAHQEYEVGGTPMVEEVAVLGVFEVGDGLRMTVTASGQNSSIIRVTGLVQSTKNQVVNFYSSLHGTLVSKLSEVSPGEVLVTVPYGRDTLGELTFWQGDTSEGPKRIWYFVP